MVLVVVKPFSSCKILFFFFYGTLEEGKAARAAAFAAQVSLHSAKSLREKHFSEYVYIFPNMFHQL